MMLELSTFSLPELLDSEIAIAEYWRQVLVDGDAGEIARALDHICVARLRMSSEASTVSAESRRN
ncbi:MULTISPECIES: hypothetical protein [Pseudomonas]|uniref:hypothetical protein n=1 Tax=Pseudomonas TaxID=286 RepID=UPI002FBD312C